MLLLALRARLGCCPHLTVTLLARLAQLLQVAPLARVRRGLQVSGSVRAFGSGLCWS